jgi:hypothetical protein
MRIRTKQLFSRFLHEVEEREQLIGGTCSCSRPHDRLITPGMRTTLDQLRDAVNNEPETKDWTLGELIGQELKD